MSGVTAEQDNKITDYGTTSYGRERRQSVEGAMDYRTTRLLSTEGAEGGGQSFARVRLTVIAD
jgi:hypothetical protein